MPNCPKCGYEYRPEIGTCPSCRTPAPKPASARAVLGLALVACVGPWLWIEATLALNRALRLDNTNSTIFIVAIVMLAVALLYGYFRGITTREGTLLRAWPLSGGLHVAVSGTMILTGVYPQPWKLPFLIVFLCLCSGMGLVFIHAGSVLRRAKSTGSSYG